MPGNSGSPIWIYYPGIGHFVIGIHSQGGVSSNTGCRLTLKKLQLIHGLIEQSYDVESPNLMQNMGRIIVEPRQFPLNLSPPQNEEDKNIESDDETSKPIDPYLKKNDIDDLDNINLVTKSKKKMKSRLFIKS